MITDAIALNLSEVRRSSTLALLVLGPGTLLSAALIAVLSWWLLDLSPAAAAVLGAALASTDPVLLRGLLRREDIPSAARQALRLESGLNDVVLLPIVLVAMAFLANAASNNASDWARLALGLFVLGPAAGVLVAVAGVATMVVIRRRTGIRRDYESLFSFVLFGASLIWSGFALLSLPVVLFALLALLVRPVAFLLSLARVRLSRPERVLIACFGPRGLSSLLLVLLPVFAGIAGSEQLFALCSLVVLLSVMVHGGSPLILARRRPPAQDQPMTTAADREAASRSLSPLTSLPLGSKERDDGTQPDDGKRSGEALQEASGTERANETRQTHPLRISLEEMRRLIQQGVQVIVLDVRTERSYQGSDLQARGAIRLVPERVASQARALGLPPEAWLIAYCA